MKSMKSTGAFWQFAVKSFWQFADSKEEDEIHGGRMGGGNDNAVKAPGYVSCAALLRCTSGFGE